MCAERTPYRPCKYDKCPGVIPDFWIKPDGYHETCRKAKAEEEKRIETEHGTWRKVSLPELAMLIASDTNVIHDFKRQVR